jgi:hypothetical protein
MTIRPLVVAACAAAILWAHGDPASSLAAAREADSSAGVIPAWYATARTAPATPVQLSRVLAMVHAAMHDAVNGAEPRYETYASDITDSRAHPEAAAAAAAHCVLSALFPVRQATWDAALVASLSTIADDRAKAFGVTLGAAVGQQILTVRADDGWNGVDPFDPVASPGVWRPTPPAFLPMPEPQFQNVTPFAIESRAQFWVAPPPALTTGDYQRVFEEVRSIGQDTSATRTADQTDIAHFWFEPPYDSWSRIAGILHADHGYDLHQTARLYALVNMVVADGLVSGWYWKRQYAFWRPITAIREAGLDGNPRTGEDPAWQPLRATPTHPDHPSTHSVTGGAAAEVIRRFVGADRHRFCMTTLTAIPSGSTRCFETFSQAQKENMNSRVYAGIHFRSAIQEAIGWGVGSAASRSNTRFDPCGATANPVITTSRTADPTGSRHPRRP